MDRRGERANITPRIGYYGWTNMQDHSVSAVKCGDSALDSSLDRHIDSSPDYFLDSCLDYSLDISIFYI